MFQTKKDVDRHVRSSFARLRDNEKNLRGYTIAKLYYKIGEYTTAEHYVRLYLSANDNCAAAHKFLGQCYEKLKKPDKALVAYQRSFELDKKQPDLLIEICRLLQSDELTGVTAAKARYWYKLAESGNIQHDAVLNLKLKYLNEEENVQDIILKNVVSRPFDVGLRIRLLRHFLDQNKVNDAFKYAFDIEMKQNGQFRNSMDWYANVAQILAKYKTANESTLKTNWPYWLLLICTLERQTYLSLTQCPSDSTSISANLSDSASFLFEFDQNLNKVAGYNICPDNERELASQFLYHFRGQLCLHTATLLFKRELAAIPRNEWYETTRSALPLLLLAYNCGVIEKSQPWLLNSTENTKQLVRLWCVQSSFRCSQAGRTLNACIDSSASSNNSALANLRKICTEKYGLWTNCDDILTEIRRSTTDPDWRKKLYKKLFTNKDHANSTATSYFVNCIALETPTYDWPQLIDLETYEGTAQDIEPTSLSHLVYLTLGSDGGKGTSDTSVNPDVRCRIFKDLNFSISNLVNCGAETLNQLDIDTFLYGATIQAKRNIEVDKSNLTRSGSNKPKILPYANMQNRLCTEEQADWWTAAYKVCNNISGDELSELRTTLQDGIEAVRGVGSPKVDLIILLKLGKIFYKRAQDTNRTVERGFLESRTEALFKYSLHMLRMQSSNRTIEPFRRLFKYAVGSNKSEIDTDSNNLAEEAITFLAGRYFKNNEFEECIEDFSGIKLPFATYFQAEAYRKMTELSNTPKKNKRAYFDKARDYLSQTIELLDAPNVDRNHPLKSIVDGDIKRLQHDSRKLETNQSLNDSFVSANGTNDLNDSFSRSRHEMVTQPAPVVVANTENLERLIREMMQSLTLLTQDVSDVRKKVQNIEEQMSRRQLNQDAGSVDPLEEYFLLEDELQQTAGSGYLNNSSMYTNTSRLNTPSQQQQQNLVQQRNAQFNLQQQAAVAAATAAALNSPYNMNPLYNGIYPNQFNPMNAYQAALTNAAVTPNRNQLATGPFNSTYTPPQGPLHYMNEPLSNAFNVQQQALQHPPAPQQLAIDQRSQLPAVQQQQQFQMPQQSVTTTIPAATNDSILGTNNQQQILKTWNSAFNNAPVEKGPPVNVVITSSDPLPTHTTISPANQQALSVTIPPQHIKNSTVNTPTSASKASPAIIAALQEKPQQKQPQQKPSSPAQSKDAAKKDVPEKENSTVPSLAQQKTIFGSGLTQFSSTPFSSPTISFGSPKTPQDKSKADTSTTETSKSNPFAGFSFGNLATAVSSQTTATTTDSKPSFGNLFSNIGQAPSTSEPQPTPAVQLERRGDNVANVSSTSGRDEEEDDYVPTAHFEPVISLPDLVEVQTGEENERALFEHRAKLLRFVKEIKEWKERGIGNMKVLVNNSDPNKVRLLMRREQVLKLCCNQLLTKDTKFNKLPSTECALSWYGQDYSENELQVELLAIRFKTPELCKQFHDAVLEAQRNMTIGGNVMPDSSTNASDKVDSKKTTEKGFGNQFKPEAGSWSCDGCYIANKGADKKCVACGSPKDKNAVEDTPKAAPAKSQFSFGLQPANKTSSSKPPNTTSGFGDQFKPKAGSWSCKSCYTSNTADNLHCLCCEEPKDDTVPKKPPQNVLGSSTGATTKFTFGFQTNSSSSPSTSTTTAASNIFGTAGTSTTTPATNFFGTSTTATGGFQFSTAVSKPVDIPKIESKEFGFVFKAKSPSKPKSPLKLHPDGVEDVSDDENVEEEENNTYFTPVIPLPEKIDVKTGEEDETALYSHRAKLFRFKDSEWKERGLGDVKILQHNKSGKLRVVMRREQILKICLNHILDRDVVYKVKDDKSWNFIVNDFSEGEVSLEQLCLRFKTPEIAQEFKKAIDDALNGITSKQNGGGDYHADVQPKQSLQSKLSAEEEKKVTDLKLPKNFFEYKDKPSCSGCRGCKSEEFVFPEVKATNFGIVDDNPLPLSAPIVKETEQSNNLSKASQPSQGNFSANSFASKPAFGPIGAKPDVTVTSAPAITTHNFFFGSPNQSVPSTADSGDSVKTSTFPFNSVFGNNVGGQQKSLGHLFGSGQKTDENSKPNGSETTTGFSFGSNPLFGGATTNTTSAVTTSSNSIFGGSSLFSFSKSDDNASKPAFGSFSFGSPAVTTTASPAAASIEPSSTTPQNLSSNKFGTPLFGFGISSPNTTNTPADTVTSSTDSQDNDNIATPLFNTTSGLSFADLAQKSNEPTTGKDLSKSIASDSTPVFSTSAGLSFADLALKSNEATTGKDLSKSTASDFSFSALAAQSNDSTNNPIFKTDTGLSFASLAQATSASPNTTFGPNNSSSTGGFIGLSHRDTFSNLMAKPQSLNGSLNNAANDNDSLVEDPNYDPHYDPIIALPDEIVVSTGEENETKLFGERGKLYRYDSTNKEWKERGVGEVKVLHHPEKNSYRVLLRREQIHKLVLNMGIGSDFQLSPMKQSDKAFCWVGSNFADESDGAVESLSVRFKNGQLAQKFNDTVHQCIEQVKSKKDLEPEED